jgi:hypothetical protein
MRLKKKENKGKNKMLKKVSLILTLLFIATAFSYTTPREEFEIDGKKTSFIYDDVPYVFWLEERKEKKYSTCESVCWVQDYERKLEHFDEGLKYAEKQMTEFASTYDQYQLGPNPNVCCTSGTPGIHTDNKQGCSSCYKLLCSAQTTSMEAFKKYTGTEKAVKTEWYEDYEYFDASYDERNKCLKETEKKIEETDCGNAHDVSLGKGVYEACKEKRYKTFITERIACERKMIEDCAERTKKYYQTRPKHCVEACKYGLGEKTINVLAPEYITVIANEKNSIPIIVEVRDADNKLITETYEHIRVWTETSYEENPGKIVIQENQKVHKTENEGKTGSNGLLNMQFIPATIPKEKFPESGKIEVTITAEHVETKKKNSITITVLPETVASIEILEPIQVLRNAALVAGKKTVLMVGIKADTKASVFETSSKKEIYLEIDIHGDEFETGKDFEVKLSESVSNSHIEKRTNPNEHITFFEKEYEDSFEWVFYEFYFDPKNTS